MKKFRLLPVLVLGFVLLICSGWGFYVHRTTHQLALNLLPANPGKFFYAHRQYLISESVRPDQRRNTDSTEAKKHYIDLEPFGDSAVYRLPRDPAVAWKENRALLEEYGSLPYEVLTMKNRLTNAMRSLQTDSILFLAADLGHYIGDAHVPLHTTINYDGQLSGQKGIHALWESLVPESDLRKYSLKPAGRAKYLSDPAETIWEVIRHAHSLLPEMLEAERAVTRNFPDSVKFMMVKRGDRTLRYYTPEFIRAYAPEVRAMVNDQLLRSSGCIANFWYTCWIDAGKPNLNALVSRDAVLKQQRKREKRSFRKDQLLKDSLLDAQKFLSTAIQ